jgi:hypothetical protein
MDFNPTVTRARLIPGEIHIHACLNHRLQSVMVRA